jgi:hypothetical protein
LLSIPLDSLAQYERRATLEVLLNKLCNRMGEHYVCTGGCEGVSPKQTTCGAPECPKHDTPLTACSCVDGMHLEAYEKDEKDGAM